MMKLTCHLLVTTPPKPVKSYIKGIYCTISYSTVGVKTNTTVGVRTNTAVFIRHLQLKALLKPKVGNKPATLQ